MEAILIVLVVMIALDVVAWKRGFDSRESLNSPEWERRESKQMFM